MPGESPPEVNTAILLIFFSINQYLKGENRELGRRLMWKGKWRGGCNVFAAEAVAERRSEL
jgi:hypothetical protein